MLFDDPLSALDGNVGNYLMENTFCKELRNKTRVIVTHALQYLKFADVVIFMSKGEIVFNGTYADLRKSEHLKAYSMEEPKEEKEKAKTVTAKPVAKIDNEIRVLGVAKEEKLNPIVSRFANEEKSTGGLSCSVIHKFIQNTGGYIVNLLIVLFNIAGATGQVFAVRFLIAWSNDYTQDTKWQNLGIYSAILYAYCSIAIVRIGLHLGLGVGFARRIHSSMFFRVLHAQVEEFIEKVPTGRLINRFTKDIEVIDKSIMRTMTAFTFNILLVFSDCFFMVYSLSVYISIPLAIYLFTSFYLQRQSMAVKREAVRMEAISKSPIVSWTSETIKGLPQIRSLDKANYVKQIMIDLLHANMANSFLSNGLDCWFKLRIYLTNVFIVQIPSYLYIIYYDINISVVEVTMFVFLSTIMAEDILRTLTFFSDFEANLISVERVTFSEQIPYEKNYKNFEKERTKYLMIDQKQELKKLTPKLTNKIVTEGVVEFRNVTARYGEDAEPVLKDLTFTARSGEKIGIVGRTGAGKSSLIKLFFMSLKPSEGQVLIDGVDIAKVDLKDLRNEVMVVSQDAALFQGNLAENIDPTLEEEDFPMVINILEDMGLKNKNILEQQMKAKVDAEGSNFSQGERQMICFSRTLIHKRKLIILDEATANIDVKTEMEIKRIQETEFNDSTMFIIAHRLKTVMHCDRIMVLKFGRIVEFDSPQTLLSTPGSLFKEMWDKVRETGEE